MALVGPTLVEDGQKTRDHQNFNLGSFANIESGWANVDSFRTGRAPEPMPKSDIQGINYSRATRADREGICFALHLYSLLLCSMATRERLFAQ